MSRKYLETRPNNEEDHIEDTNWWCYAVQRICQRRFGVYNGKRSGMNWTMQTRSQDKRIEIDIRVQQNVVYNASFEKRDVNSVVLLEGGQGSKSKLRHLPPPVTAVASHFNDVWYR